MNRSNPVFFLAFLVSVVALLGGVALAKGGLSDVSAYGSKWR
jgi:hypothetical protein